VDWLAEANVSEKRAASIFRAEDGDGTLQSLKMEATRFSETLTSANQSTRRFNPNEYRQHCHRPEHSKSHNSQEIGKRRTDTAAVMWISKTRLDARTAAKRLKTLFGPK
jgi:hypothetical protein